MMLKNIFLGLVIIFFGCEKFTEYNYDSDSIGHSSHIYGTVLNTFYPYQPVKNARVELGYLTFYADSLGKYDINYILGVDDNRNKPVDIVVSAPDYHDLVTEIIVQIPEQNLNLNLDYAAPKIDSIWIGVQSNVYHQVIVTDNQGFENIQSVVTIFYYANIFDPVIKTRTMEMTFKGVVLESNISAYYQAVPSASYEEGWHYTNRWINFVVIDKDGFSQVINKKYSNIISPDPLFPIIDI